MKKIMNNNKGITLIALAITIIILLILAGISISALTGEDSIINEANEAKDATELAREEEARELNEVQSLKYANIKTELTSEEATAKGWESNSGSITAYTGTDTEVYIPSKIGNTKISNIYSTVFNSNTTIKKVIIPGSIEIISARLFEGCSNLETVMLGEGVTKINGNVFYGCYKLEYLALPSTLTGIENFGLANSGIRNIVIPSSVTTVGGEIFEYCKNPITIHCEAELEDGENVPTGDNYSWSEDWLKNAPEGTTVEWGYER